MAQAGSCSVRLVSIDSIVPKVFGVHFSYQRMFVLDNLARMALT